MCTPVVSLFVWCLSFWLVYVCLASGASVWSLIVVLLTFCIFSVCLSVCLIFNFSSVYLVFLCLLLVCLVYVCLCGVCGGEISFGISCHFVRIFLESYRNLWNLENLARIIGIS